MDFCVPEAEDILSSQNSNDSMLIQFIDFGAFVPNVDCHSFFFKKSRLFVLQPREATIRLFGSEDKVSKFR